jgi:hypothetical protein
MQVAIQEIERGKYAESFSSGIEFSMGVIKQGQVRPLFGFTTCKDFLTDVIWSEKTKKPFGLYKFNWKPQNILRKNIYILVRNKDTNITEVQSKTLQNILNFWENQLGFKRSSVGIQEQLLVVKMSKDWFEKPYMMALFTTLLSCYPVRREFVDFEDFMVVAKNDAIRSRYFYDFEKVIRKIWSGENLVFQDYDDNLTPHQIHYNLGLTYVNK